MHASPASLSDPELLAATTGAAGVERRATAHLLALLAEVDTRGLYLGLGHSSLFTYCTKTLHLSESAAYSRITAARVGRKFPLILSLLDDGSVNLTTVSLLAAHLNTDNHAALLEAARHKSRREVEQLVARLDPQPDVPSSVRRLPAKAEAAHTSTSPATEASARPVMPPPATSARRDLAAAPSPRRAIVAPLAADRYLLKVTLSETAYATLQQARDLLRHQIPNGDPAAIVERALMTLVEQLAKTRCGAVRRPRRRKSERPTSRSRHVPASVRRAVWVRDGGQRAFVGTGGRCSETGCLEFHHVVPFADGGATSVQNIELRCRAHNGYEAARWFGLT